MEKVSLKLKNNALVRGSMLEMKRDLSAWRAIRGIWSGKKIKDPVVWQRKIRKDWERVLP